MFKNLIIFFTFFASKSFAIIINENMGDINEWYDSANKFPFVVQRTNSEGGMFCTGTLINPRTVLSAAHCQKSTEQQIWIGSDVSTSTTKINVTSDIHHPIYDSYTDTRYDFSIISLETPIYSITDFPEVYDGNDLANQEVYLVGYGTKGNNSGYNYYSVASVNLPDGKRRWVTNKISTFAVGGDKYYLASFSNPADSSATVQEGTVAPGDSGGPILLETITDGVSTYKILGTACCITLSGVTGGIYGTYVFWSDVRTFKDYLSENNPLKSASSQANGNWNSSSSWSNNIIPNNFSNTTSGSNLNSNSARYFNVSISDTINLNSSINIDNLNLNSSASLIINSGAILNLSGILQSEESNLQINGTFNSNFISLNNSNISGEGTIVSTVNFINSTLKPGNSIGEITFNGDLNLDSNSIMEIEINPSGDSDLVKVSGVAKLDGALKILPLSQAGKFYKKGMTFVYLNYGSSTGNFSSKQVLDPNKFLGFLNHIFSPDNKQLTFINPNYENLSLSSKTKEIAKNLDNLEQISSSNIDLYNNIQGVLDEINLSPSQSILDSQLLYFYPDYNHSIGVNITNLIFLKKNIEHIDSNSFFTASISKSNLSQKNDLKGDVDHFFSTLNYENFAVGVGFSRTSLDYSSQNEIKSSSFFLTSNKIFKNNKINLELIATFSESNLERIRSLQLNTSSSSEIAITKSKFDSDYFMIGLNYEHGDFNQKDHLIWKYIKKIGLNFLKYNQDKFIEDNHPRILNLNTEKFSKNILIATLEAKLFNDLTFNKENPFVLSSSISYDYISSPGSINTFLDKNLGTFNLKNDYFLENIYSVDFKIKRKFQQSSVSLKFDFGNSSRNVSLSYKIPF